MQTCMISVQVENPAGGKGQGFSFDHVFSPSASQAAVFAQVSELVQSALDGYQVGIQLPVPFHPLQWL